MAKVSGVSHTSVQRIRKAHGLKPHPTKTFKLSNDPKFLDKVEDIVGLYLNPPANATVLSVDEKSQACPREGGIQASGPHPAGPAAEARQMRDHAL